MKKSKIRIFVCLMAAVSCTAAFSVNALAYSTGATSPTLSSSSAEQSSTASPSASSATSSGTSLKPLTPDGTGTVIDNVTNEDGKEFFTITTPSKHVFYLIIDRQKDAENVYFLDAVTDKDLLALAKSDGEDVSGSSSKTASTPEISSAPTALNPTVSSNSQPEKQNSSAGIAAVAVLAAVLVGAAVWFFKLRKPGKKDKNKPDPDDYDYAGDEDEDNESGPEDEPEVPDEETEQKDEPETFDGETEREDE